MGAPRRRPDSGPVAGMNEDALEAELADRALGLFDENRPAAGQDGREGVERTLVFLLDLGGVVAPLRASCQGAITSSNGRAKLSKIKCLAIVMSVAAVSLASTATQAQQPPPQSPNMTFFITSAGPGKGADLGGLEGA